MDGRAFGDAIKAMIILALVGGVVLGGGIVGVIWLVSR